MVIRNLQVGFSRERFILVETVRPVSLCVIEIKGKKKVIQKAIYSMTTYMVLEHDFRATEENSDNGSANLTI